MSGVAALTLTAAKGAARDRPNILWIVSEDNNPFIGAYGDKVARTPNIDALASKGVLFNHAYCAAPVCAPSRFALITGVHPESCAPANHMRAVAKVPKEWRATPEYLRDVGYYCTNNSKTDYNCDIDPAKIWDQCDAQAHWRNRKQPEQPFFSIFNSMTTHESKLFVKTEGATKAADVVLPPYLPDTPEIREDYASYYNLMTKMDGEVGARLAELEADGLADNTIVFYYSDNGGTLPRSKRYCYDEGLRVALVAYCPPKWRHLMPQQPGTQVEDAVGLIDLPPTILGLCGVTKPAHMQGETLFPPRGKRHHRYAFGMRNRMDERPDFVRTVTDGRYRYIRNYMPYLPAAQVQGFAWTAKGYQSWERMHLEGKLPLLQDRFFQPRPHEELYDLQTDPGEMTDLAASTQAASVLREMRAALDRHMIEINDNGFIPEASPLEGFHPSRAPGAYPLPRIMQLAARAASRQPQDLELFVKNLTDANEVVRYWAALGVLMIGSNAVNAQGILRDRLRAELSVHVRVALAEALGHAGDTTASVKALNAMIAPENLPRVRLAALNALTHLGRPALAALPAIQLASGDKDQYIARAAKYLALNLTGQYDPSIPLSTGEAKGG
ncbi:sulfatase-like hydrolase/transferase [Sphingobium sp. HWE2-09]|uniref:sulfatase-like hydrolase/transferase n=1 Tax=Sphingobium sp. HWE2-09 TaxID=3108390 RepID=UPI002DCE8F5A|nr:sulfatase-like hydrolase/transferase [Sphingobium sp. HWE2-09]